MAVDLVFNLLGFDKTGPAFKSASSNMSRLGKSADDAGGRVRGAFTGLGGLAAGAGAAGAAAGAAFAASVMEGVNRSAETDQVAAALGMSPAEAERLGRVSAEIYAGAWGASTAEVNAALQSVTQQIEGMASASDAELKAATTTALDLAKAFQVDVGQASTAAGDLIRNGLAKDSKQAFDVITAGFQAGADKRGDFLDTITEYSVQFRKLGLDGAAATGLLAQGLNAGARDADKVADALKELSIRAIDGSASTRAAYAALGLDAEQMMARFGAGGASASAALTEVLAKLRGMQDPVAQSAAAVGLFGTQAEDMGAALFALDPSSAVAALGQVEGAAANMGATLNDNAATRIEQFKRQFQDLGLQLVERTGDFGAAGFAAASMSPDLLMAAGAVGQVVLAVKALSLAVAWNTAKVAANKAVWAAGQFLTAVKFVGLLAFEVGKSTAAWVGNTVVQGANKAATLASAAASVVARGAVLAWTGVQWALNAALTANPIGLVVAAIGAMIAAVVLLWKNNEGFRAVVLKVWDAIKSAIGGVADWFREHVPPIWEAVKARIGAAMEAVRGIIETVWRAIAWYVTTYVTVVRTVAEFAFNAIRTYISTVMGAVRWVIDTAWSGIVGAWQAATQIVAGVTQRVMGSVTGWVSAGLDRVKALFGMAVGAIGGIWGRLEGAVRGPVRSMFGFINRTMIEPINGILGKFGSGIEIRPLPTNFADGGHVRGPGGPRTDSIPANLSNGEFVVNAASTARFAPLLEAINAARGGFGIGGASVEAQILAWLRGQGMSDAGIAGILGNIQAESGMNPSAIEGGNGEGHGLIQWSFSRKQDLFAFARQRGTSWTDIGTQLSFLASELSAYPQMWSQLLGASDPRAASRLFSNTFVRPGIYGARDDHAAAFYRAMQSGALTPTSGVSLFDRVAGAAASLFRPLIEGVTGPALAGLEGLAGGSWPGRLVVGLARKAADAALAWATRRDEVPSVVGFDGPGAGFLARPLSGYAVTSEFRGPGRPNHMGIDLGAPMGTPVLAAAAGRVTRAGWNGGYGNFVAIDHGAGLSTTYAHMASIAAQAGQIIAQRGLVGTVGSTGDSTGPHLHFEVLQGGAHVNPRSMVQFDDGGFLEPGWSAVYNGTGRPEPVFTDQQWRAMSGGRTVVEVYLDGRQLVEAQTRYRREAGVL